MTGGQPPKPGEISLAHGGVLFLDEFTEFARDAVEALREPMETRRITISRAARQAQFPAGFQLVAACNPCPCGWLGADVAGRECRCTPAQVARYRARLSGPILDRIDVQVEVAAIAPGELLGAPAGESSAAVAARVRDADARQHARQGKPNGRLEAAELDEAAAPDDAGLRLLTQAAIRLGWSGRAMHRALKVARTIADLDGCDGVGAAHIAEAIQYRRAFATAGG